MNTRTKTVLLLLTLTSSGLAPQLVQAQGEIVGKVLADSSQGPVVEATLTIATLGKSVRSDSTGRFKMLDIPPGDHVLLVRALGYAEVRAEITIESNEVIVKDFTMKRVAQVLAGTTVTTTAPVNGKMSAFMERKAHGIGHFITRDKLADAEGRRRTGDLLAMAPGTAVKRGGSKAWVASGGRAVNKQGGGCAFCRGGSALNNADRSAGAPQACYMDVYLDGNMVFNSTQPSGGLFDINSMPPEQLEGIEVYTSASQIPAQYNRTANGCGVILLWTR